MLLFIPSMDWAKQEAHLLRWAFEHRYEVTSLARYPDDAVRLAVGGFVDVIVVATHTVATTAMASRAALAGVVVEEVRPGPVTTVSTSTHAVRITEPARRGVPAEAIAAVVDLPLVTVQQVLDGDPAGPVAGPVQHSRERRRARLVSRAGGRR